jgi:hypothetical protein
VTVVILSAVVPTFVAQRAFSPPVHELLAEEAVAVEGEGFEPHRAGRRRGRATGGPRPRA